jgi:anaerobic sulfite reductase subunit B
VSANLADLVRAAAAERGDHVAVRSGGRSLTWHQVDVTVDAAAAGWRGRVGVVTTLLGGIRFDPAETVALVCGPELMMHFAARELLARGVAPDRIHVSMERNMRCGVGHCGHCQLGPTLICRDGPVYRLSDVEPLLAVREL